MLPYYVETELWDDGVVELEEKRQTDKQRNLKILFYNIL